MSLKLERLEEKYFGVAVDIENTNTKVQSSNQCQNPQLYLGHFSKKPDYV